MILGASRSGKSTLIRAAEAIEHTEESYDCRKNPVEAGTGIDADVKKVDIVFKGGLKLSFSIIGDYGGQPEQQIIHLKNNLSDILNIVYCFDASLLAEDKTIPLKNREEPIAVYTKAAIMQCTKYMKEVLAKEPKRMRVKNFIFLGTHYDLVTDKEANSVGCLRDKIGYTDLYTQVKNVKDTIRVAFVCGDFTSYENSQEIWKKIAQELD